MLEHRKHGKNQCFRPTLCLNMRKLRGVLKENNEKTLQKLFFVEPSLDRFSVSWPVA